jgi:hypothetical protein
VGSGRGRMALQPARAPSAGARRSFPLGGLPQPRATPSTAPAHATPRRLRAPGSSMAAATRFWDARRKSGGASALAFAPSLARRLLSGSGAHAGGVGARPHGWSAAGRHSRRLPFSSRGSPCTGTSCTRRRSPFPSWAWPCTSTPYAGCRSRGSASTSSSRCRRVSSSSSWCLASASSSSCARHWSSTPRCCGAGSDEELLDVVATQTFHSRVGS